jgi:hypothetical protein
MLVVDAKALDRATEMLMAAAMGVKTEAGLRVSSMLPRRAAVEGPNGILDTCDYPRCRAIALAAVVSLVGDAARVSDEVLL